MPLGSGSNRDNLDVKDRQILKGPGADDGGATVPQDSPGQHLFQLTPTKGSILVGNGTVWALLASTLVNGQILTIDTAEPTGLKWSDAPTVVEVDFDFADGTGFQFADADTFSFAG